MAPPVAGRQWDFAAKREDEGKEEDTGAALSVYAASGSAFGFYDRSESGCGGCQSAGWLCAVRFYRAVSVDFPVAVFLPEKEDSGCADRIFGGVCLGAEAAIV